MVEIAEVSVTFHDETLAQETGRKLVESRLAACVHVEGPLTSTYWWDGKLQCEPEWRLTAKTAAALASDVVEALGADHPYDLPGIVVHQADCTQDFADWVGRETRPSS